MGILLVVASLVSVSPVFAEKKGAFPMLMLSRATEIPRASLRGIRTPDPTDSWRPVPQADVVDVLTERAGTRGLKITSERFAVMPGYLYPTPGTSVELPGARLFGSMDFAPISGMPFPPGCTPSAGIRNSHDKMFALSILSGARVLVCANSVLSAEFIISRKHTSGIDLAASVDQALDGFLESIRGFQVMHDRLSNLRLTRTRANALTVDMARAARSQAVASCRCWTSTRNPASLASPPVSRRTPRMMTKGLGATPASAQQWGQHPKKQTSTSAHFVLSASISHGGISWKSLATGGATDTRPVSGSCGTICARCTCRAGMVRLRTHCPKVSRSSSLRTIFGAVFITSPPWRFDDLQREKFTNCEPLH